MTEHPVIRKGTWQLFITMDNNKLGKKLNAATLSRWICNTIMEAHTAASDGKNLPKIDEPYKVRIVVAFLSLFWKGDLQNGVEGWQIV